jgi:hypothetical protein
MSSVSTNKTLGFADPPAAVDRLPEFAEFVARPEDDPDFEHAAHTSTMSNAHRSPRDRTPVNVRRAGRKVPAAP